MSRRISCLFVRNSRQFRERSILGESIGIGRRPINTAFKRGQDNVIDLASRGRSERRRLVERLFGEHAHALRVFLKGRLVPPDEIEDLVQELFVRLMKVKRLEEKMSASSGSNRSYLLTMANNMVVDQQRKASIRSNYAARQKGVPGDHIDERTPEEIVAAQLELEAMRAVILAMRPTWRQAFVLHRFRNMSYEDIALHMGMTVKQVENCIAQAMKRIRKARRRIESAGT
ncbi:MAG: sigma-70 family RNA polymerase sigma factor [Gammaproteobacteria bacterium]|nr:sigma-70 family RNA polymerase sigma factor [Gammaproteobacteria bacterium]MYL01964.1 sigma-70 family RNA polymerase sigma factor [Gammaproteobacteria bacterium]